jgi:CheY-like chemotaxis protein
MPGKGQGRILLAEDNTANQRLALRQLKKLGYEVDIVSNGQQALDRLREKPDVYDLVLMDCQMPELDGMEATRRLRASERGTGQHKLVVAMTANAMIGDRELCISAGMDDYISKPVKMEDLQIVLQKWRMNSSVRKEAVEDSKSPAVTYDAVDLLDAKSIQAIRDLQTEGEPDLFLELIEIFLKESQVLMGKARQAVQAADADALRQAAHSIKGTSSNLGAKLLSSRAAEIEQLARSGDVQKAATLLGSLEDVYQQSCAALNDAAK